jgi:hypothetical protein
MRLFISESCRALILCRRHLWSRRLLASGRLYQCRICLPSGLFLASIPSRHQTDPVMLDKAERHCWHIHLLGHIDEKKSLFSRMEISNNGVLTTTPPSACIQIEAQGRLGRLGGEC